MDMNATINALAARVPTDAHIHVGQDGLAYCLNCGGARECRIEIFDRVRVVPCLCKCMAEKRAQEEALRKQQELMARIAAYRDIGFPDREMQAYTFKNDDGAQPTLTKAMQAYVEHFDEFRKEGKGLYLYGPVGTGKTFHAASVVNALIDEGTPCLMTNLTRVTNKISGTWEGRQDYIDSLSRFHLVGIDDLGVERNTEYMNESVTTIIDSLYRAKVPMIITSNYTPAQLVDEADIRRKRVYDRLLERCHPIYVAGESRRKNKGRSDYYTMKNILGL